MPKNLFKVVLCSTDFELNIALGTIQSCAVYMEMYGDTAIELLHKRKIQADSHCYLYKFNPKNSPHKTQLHTNFLLQRNVKEILVIFYGNSFVCSQESSCSSIYFLNQLFKNFLT